MNLTLHQFALPCRHRFTIARGTTTVQRTLIVELRQGGCTGYGEAVESSYYGATIEGMRAALERVGPQIEAISLHDPAEFWEETLRLLRGVEPRLGGGVGMDPRNRWADWYKGLYFVFPDRDRTGIQLAKGSLNPIPWALPATLDELRDPKIWRKSPAYQAAAQKLWKSQRPGTGVRGLVFAGDTLWIAGSREEGGAVHALSMTDGSMAEACAFDAIPTFEGLSAARSRLFVACSDGKILCLGK